MSADKTLSPVRLTMRSGPGQPEPSPALEQLYRGFEQELLVPLWTEIGDLMPPHPRSKASPHLWRPGWPPSWRSGASTCCASSPRCEPSNRAAIGFSSKARAGSTSP